jgi:hypothetical protein
VRGPLHQGLHDGRVSCCRSEVQRPITRGAAPVRGAAPTRMIEQRLHDFGVTEAACQLQGGETTIPDASCHVEIGIGRLGQFPDSSQVTLLACLEHGELTPVALAKKPSVIAARRRQRLLPFGRLRLGQTLLAEVVDQVRQPPRRHARGLIGRQVQPQMAAGTPWLEDLDHVAPSQLFGQLEGDAIMLVQ